MENELIRVTTNEEGIQCVSARELHEFLEIGTRFDIWFGRMVDYGFQEGMDYEKIVSEVHVQKRTRTYEQVDYAITLDMAKELSMIQRSEKGKQARQYFIQCEKKLKEVTSQQPQLTLEDNLILQVVKAQDIGQRMVALNEYGNLKLEQGKEEVRETEVKPLLQENEQHKQVIKEQRPYVDIAKERIVKGECISLTDITKGLNLKKGQISVWAKMNGFISKVGTEINKKGEEYFKIYLTREGYKCIGVREKGIDLINSSLEEIKNSPCRLSNDKKNNKKKKEIKSNTPRPCF